MLDRFLLLLDRTLFRLPIRSGRLERAVYDLICQRLHKRRWDEAVAAHKASGGLVVTHAWDGGETITLVGGA